MTRRFVKASTFPSIHTVHTHTHNARNVMLSRSNPIKCIYHSFLDYISSRVGFELYRCARRGLRLICRQCAWRALSTHLVFEVRAVLMMGLSTHRILSIEKCERIQQHKDGADLWSRAYKLLAEMCVIIMWNTIHLQGEAVTQNVSNGVIISTRSLVLQKVGRSHAGFYACAAANDRGENQSAVVNLRIHCKSIYIL